MCTINGKAITFDAAKNELNERSRGISFRGVVQFDWSTALVSEDLRRDYGEPRYQALGFIGERLHALVFTPRKNSIHVISLRKANAREVRRHEQETKT